MRTTRLTIFVLLALSLCLVPLAGAQDAPVCTTIGFLSGWARASMPGMPNSAAYGVLANLGDTDDTLIGASSGAAEAVELHEMVMAEGDVMQMRPLADGIPVLAGEAAILQPGGLHIMLIGLTEPLVAGETLEITLHFAEREDLVLSLPIRDPDAEMPMQAMGHGHS